MDSLVDSPAGCKPENQVANTSAMIGRILTIRHGRPDVTGRTGPPMPGGQYIDWWARYEQASLAPDQRPDAELIARADNAVFLFASPRPRAVQTAQLLAGDRRICIDEVFVECPLPLPDLPDRIRLSPRWWGFVSRLIWLCGYSGGQESAQQAQHRAQRAAQLLTQTANTGHDVVLVAHGWFNHTLHRHIVRSGWKRTPVAKPGILPNCNTYWGHRLYEYAVR